ncbi:MAG: hypothetical protein QOK10_3310 [Pseudonocardiales bacterium]|jgi:hypothetical protein|nr:hypothetical protein [Pseudonocardiales bacterium]
MTEWSSPALVLPWLRGQGLHVAASATLDAVRDALFASGYLIAHAHTGPGRSRQDAYRSLAAALRLRQSAADNLDAFADALRELPDLWPETRRLVLLWTGADSLVRTDLLAWTMLGKVLVETSDYLWLPDDERGLVFDTIAFVPTDYGADHP